MATYSAVSAGEKDADSPVSVGLVDKLDQNPHAIAEGASGAPKILTAAINSSAVTESKMASSAVNRAALKSTTQEVSAALSASGISHLSFTSVGEYGFYPQVRSSGGGFAYSAAITKASRSNASYDGTYIGVKDESAGANTVYGKIRYIQASPPYQLGGHDIPLFVYALLDSSGNIKSVNTAGDPPWAYNGPNSIVPDIVRNGKAYKRVAKINKELSPSERFQALAALKADSTSLKRQAQNAHKARMGSLEASNRAAVGASRDKLKGIVNESKASQTRGVKAKLLQALNDFKSEGNAERQRAITKEITDLTEALAGASNDLPQSKVNEIVSERIKFAELLADTEKAIASEKARYKQDLLNAELLVYDEVEITTAYKNTDMQLFPHTYLDDAKADDRIVMIAPAESMLEQLHMLHEEGESICEIVHGDFVRMGDAVDLTESPNGVQVLRASWR